MPAAADVAANSSNKPYSISAWLSAMAHVASDVWRQHVAAAWLGV